MRLTIVIILIALGLGVGIYISSQKTLPVKTLLPHKGEIYAFIEEEGTTALPETSLVTMPFSGKIQKITIREGAHVQRGQRVASMNLDDLRAKVDFYRAREAELQAIIQEHEDNRIENTALQEIQTEVTAFSTLVKTSKKQEKLTLVQQENEERKYKKSLKLQKQKTISEEEVEEARVRFISAQIEHQKNKLLSNSWATALIAVKLWPLLIQRYIKKKSLKKAVFQSQLRQIRIQLQTAQNHLKRAVLHSPIDGIVLKRYIQSERELAQGTTLLKLGQLNQLEIRISLLTEDATKIHRGDPAEIYGQSFAKPLRGRVKKIYPQGFTKISSLGVEQQRVYVIVSFPSGGKGPSSLGVDYRAYVRILYKHARGLVIPRTALFRGLDGYQQVFVVRDGVARLKKVKTGILNNNQAQIIEGLSGDFPVVISPGTDLLDGMAVSE